MVDLVDEERQEISSAGEIEVLASKQTVQASKLFNGLSDAQRSASFLTYFVGHIAHATGSAIGVDRQHHIVNQFLNGYVPFKSDDIWVPMQTLARKKRYMYDHLQYWGAADIWQNSREAHQEPRGDCEDHAIALADWLVDMGEDARVAVGMHNTTGHAWVVLFRDGKEYIIEATSKQGFSRRKPYPLASIMPAYQPLFMFNREYFWANSGSQYTTSYSGKKWKKNSRYRTQSS